MAKINLLPWRAERRKQRQKEFMTMLGVAAAIAVLVSLLIVLSYNAKIDAQAVISYRKKQQEGKIQVMVAAWPSGNSPTSRPAITSPRPRSRAPTASCMPWKCTSSPRRCAVFPKASFPGTCSPTA